MKTWYKVSGSHRHIEPVDVIKENEKSITILRPGIFENKPYEQKAYKLSSYDSYYPTLPEAVEFARMQLESKVKYLSTQLDEAQSVLYAFNNKYPA
jgi:hypothetical protein